MNDSLLAVLACPKCGGSLRSGNGRLTCDNCGHDVPVVGGIPRFVITPDSEEARRTQASFGYEWTHFNDWQPSGTTNFTDYFSGLDLAGLRDSLVLDAGCGMGRHARQVAPHVGSVIAVDFSAAIEQASRNTAPIGNVACVQADLTRLPLRDGVFDFAYSLGVLHHIRDTEDTLRGLVRKVKPGGRVRIYLYWRRSGIAGALLSLVTAARRVTTRLPFPVLKALCWMLSVPLFALVVIPYRLLTRLGVTAIRSWPLYVYAKYPFTVLYNDQFDRFSAPIEKRYTSEEVRSMLQRVGLDHVGVFPCFGWIGEGVRRS